MLKGSGMKALNRPEPPEHFKVAAYYAVPLDIASLKTALMQYGPLSWAGAGTTRGSARSRASSRPQAAGSQVGTPS